MRRILIGVTLASIALAAAIVANRPDRPMDRGATRVFIDGMEVQLIGDANLFRILLNEPVYRRPDISAMDCRIVGEERLRGDRYLLTEECAWKDGRVERRRFQGLRRQDGSSYGWLIQPRESET